MKIYKKSAKFDRFVIPIYRRPIFYILGLFLISSLVSLPILIFNVYDIILISFLILCLILLIILVGYSIYQFIVSIKYHGRYLRASYNIKQNIIIGLLDTMTLNSPKSLDKIKVPYIFVDLTNVKKTGQAIVKIERLAGMNSIEDLSLIVSNAFKHKMGSIAYNRYAVTDLIEHDDILEYTFILTDVKEDKRLVPKTIEDLIQGDDYTITLQKGLVWELNKYVHAIISGTTNSGKSTLLRSICIQAFYKGIDTIIIDPKNEFSVFTFLEDKIINDSSKYISALENIIAIMEEREKEVAVALKTADKIGLSGYDLGFKPILIIIDELSSVVAGFDSKEQKQWDNLLKKLIQRSRSSSIYLVVGLQNANATTISVAVRNQFNLRILLSSNNKEDIGFIFGSNNETIAGAVEKFKGYYMKVGETNTPQKFFVTDMRLIDDVEYYRKAYRIGEEDNDKR